MPPAIHRCTSCRKSFERATSLTSHIRQATRCKWLLATVQSAMDDLRASDDEDPNISANNELLNPNPGSDPSLMLLEDEWAADNFPALMPPPPPPPPPPPVLLRSASASSPEHRVHIEDEGPDHVESYPGAGRIYGYSQNVYQVYHAKFGSSSDNVYAPFKNKMDWQVGKWAKMRGSGSNAFTEMLNIDGLVEKLDLSFHNMRALNQIVDQLPDRASWQHLLLTLPTETEKFDLYFRDAVDCLKALYGDPALSNYMSYAPEKQYADLDGTSRLYNEMYTGNWWWKRQGELPEGATIIPLILSSDKTQLSIFSGDKTAYPIYLTLGNIGKATRRTPSKHAQILIGYLPTSKLHSTELSEGSMRLARARMFHAAVHCILKSLEPHAKAGIRLTGGDGAVRQCYPSIACYVADYPEQCLVACTRYGVTCPKCPVGSEQFQDNFAPDDSIVLASLRDGKQTLHTIQQASTNLTSATAINKALKLCGLNHIPKPFWAGFTAAGACNIHEAITLDILHQLYQGVIKHLVAWLQSIMTAAELDARFKRLPPMQNVRIFSGGISILSRVSGTEHKHIAKQILGCLIGRAPAAVIRASRGLLDFLYLAQYQSHSDETLQYMETALDQFHANKSIFLTLGARDSEHLNLPKIHSLQHYIGSIRNLGSADNYNTEATERLHIDFAKDGYRASNSKNELVQMVIWLERREKVVAFEAYIQSKLSSTSQTHHDGTANQNKPSTSLALPISLARQPTIPNVPFTTLSMKYGATKLVPALQTFVAQQRQNGNNPNVRQVQRRIAHAIFLGFSNVHVWHRMKFQHPNLQLDGVAPTPDAALASPACRRDGKLTAARFDAVIVNNGAEENTGFQGYRVARLRTIFSIPSENIPQLFGVGAPNPGPLAYVDWFTCAGAKDKDHGMFTVSKTKKDGIQECAVIPLHTIQRSCQLIPKFGKQADHTWTSENVLDRCNTFLVNNFVDHHTYQSVW